MTKNHRDFVREAFDGCGLPKEGTKDLRVLDVGCRDEAMRNYLMSKGYTWEGLDPYPDDKAKNIHKAKMEDMRCIKDEQYDLVFACHSFEHCERPIDALREFMRVLKPGGHIFIGGPPVCKHHILEADQDHIFVLNEMQLARLLLYTGYVQGSAWVHPGDRSQNDTVCAIGGKP